MPEHRIKEHNGYLVLCDKNGKPIPKQTYLKIESVVGEEALTVTMKCLVQPYEIEDGVCKERHYKIIEDKDA